MCGKDIPVNLTLLDKILKYIRSKLCLQVGILKRIYFLPKRFKIPKTSLSILLCIKKSYIDNILASKNYNYLQSALSCKLGTRRTCKISAVTFIVMFSACFLQ